MVRTDNVNYGSLGDPKRFGWSVKAIVFEMRVKYGISVHFWLLKFGSSADMYVACGMVLRISKASVVSILVSIGHQPFLASCACGPAVNLQPGDRGGDGGEDSHHMQLPSSWMTPTTLRP
jgi:hypothetical protein